MYCVYTYIIITVQYLMFLLIRDRRRRHRKLWTLLCLYRILEWSFVAQTTM